MSDTKLDTITIRDESFVRSPVNPKHVIVRARVPYAQNQPGDVCAVAIDAVRNVRPADAFGPVSASDVRAILAGEAERKAKSERVAR